ncbi:hypothetical protein BSKO_10672 [Bryopsis sp. KO-2023]|nr:hypothetical protein BSKO_10672 [Bryopsis sp. KO-2023]
MGRDKVHLVKARSSSQLDARNSGMRLSGTVKPSVLHGTVTRTASARGHATGPSMTGETPSLTRRTAEKPASEENNQQKDSIVVAVRFRPLNEKEKLRGDGIVWSVDDSNTVGLLVRGTFKPKFNYDHVFRDSADNREVYNSVAGDVVKIAMNGINGTIFAYGVTSSGKTHTMMGNEKQPGIVPQSICQVFEMIENMPSKEFLLRLSMMEIYNEILNDLLDPARNNLRIREHKAKGVHIDGLKEEVVLSAEHALSLIAAGEANRKVSCTAFNEDSSRSHTICRLSIEISDRTTDDEEKANVGRTLSYLNLIDLAGSESAKAAVSKGHRVEGSYINKSLLTLGTVIHKLSDGHSIHVPFRDSKLTRLLQSSLSGNGAKIAIICTVTPASMQAEEAHNTLKFASRAKKIAISCAKNEIMDEKSLIRRYQAEVKQLRRQLELTMSQREAPTPPAAQHKENDEVEEEISTLRSRLEEELRTRMKREHDKVGLEARIERLTRLILTSTRQQQQTPRQPAKFQRSRSFEAPRSMSMESAMDLYPNQPLNECASMSSSYRSPTSSIGGDSLGSMLSPASSRRSFSSDARSMLSHSIDLLDTKVKEQNQQLKEQLRLMAQAMDERERDMEELRSQTRLQGGSPKCIATCSQGTTTDGDLDVMMMQADREVLKGSLDFAKRENARLTADLVKARVELKRAKSENRRLAELERSNSLGDRKLLFAPSCMSSSRADSTATDTTQAEIGKVSPFPETPVSMRSTRDCSCGTDSSQMLRQEAEMKERVARFDQRIQAAVSEVMKKEQLLTTIRDDLKSMRCAKDRVEKELRDVFGENEKLRRDQQRQELQNNRLQGYLLDGMSSEQLNELIRNLTQAAERVRLTVQLRRLSTVSTSANCDIDNKDSSDDGVL